MPLSVNVGLSRKASKDYQSTGYSINVTAELDQSLLARPEELQTQIATLYAHAHEALDRQATPRQRDGGEQPAARQDARAAGRPEGRVAPATESQKRAIQSICRRLNADPEYQARQLLGIGFAELSVKQASQLIDELKTPSEAGRNGGGR